MSQTQTTRNATASKRGGGALLVREERFLAASLGSTLLFFCFGKWIMSGIEHPVMLAIIFAWLFLVVMGSVLGVVRHADQLAVRLGEPYGTLLLTLVVTALEVASISTMMMHGANNPTLVRDTLFAVVMIILNGMVGLSLLIGGWKHREQLYNLQGANAYLSVIIPLAVLTLVLPNFTVTTTGPTLSRLQEIFLGLMAVGLYAIFLSIQTSRHRQYFALANDEKSHEAPAGTPRTLTAHVLLLLLYMAPVVYLAEQLALPLDYAIEVLHAPAALGGIMIAVLVATPEAISAVRAATANQMQRSVNIFLGSVLATIALTVPAMLVLSHFNGRQILLGVQQSDLVLLPLTLILSVVTFSSGRTNILQGAVHLLLFAAYILLIFQG